MGLLNEIGITSGTDNKTSKIFEGLFKDFWKIKYTKPSEYVNIYWLMYKEYAKTIETNNNLNGKIFEYILATLFIREKLLPLYLGAKVAFVPNVIYDMLLYTSSRGPICISAKTSLRERYKQADLEAIALKYVHRKSLCYLVTLDKREAANMKVKIEKGDIIGLDDVIVATESEFDFLITSLKKLAFSEAPTVKIIEASQIITSSSIRKVIKK